MKHGLWTLFLVILLSMATLSGSPSTVTRTEQTTPLNGSIETLSVIPARIMWPRLACPAIVLNGSTLVVQIKGPSNLMEWNLTIHREYEKYSISCGNAERNDTTGVWNINATIPSGASKGLYDLVVSTTDGIQTTEAMEYNAIQVRNSFPDDFRVFHITDPHLKSSPSSRDDRLLSALYQASMTNADFMVLSGDIVDFGTADSFERAVDFLKQSQVPVFVGPGNHDVDSDGRGFSTYSSFFGPDYYTANIGPDIILVMCNSHGKRLNDTQIQWIERDLSQNEAETKILCIHHPLYNLNNPPNYYLDDDEAFELIDICDKHDVDMVLTGHLHNDRVDRVNGTLWILTTAIGAPVSKIAAEPDHLSHGFRVIDFEDHKPVSWNWTLQKDWSQPWDMVSLKRTPRLFRDIDTGGYIQISNNLNYSLEGQMVEIMVQIPSENQRYLTSGGTPVETINGTDAYLVRFRVDLAPGDNVTLRVFPDDAQQPQLVDIVYPQETKIGETYTIFAEWTNPTSGVSECYLNLAIDGESLGYLEMIECGRYRFRYTLKHDTPGRVTFQIIARDYAGIETTSDVYTLECVSLSDFQGPDMVQVYAVLGAILVAAGMIVYLLKTRMSPHSS